jgi:hypothetical protein
MESNEAKIHLDNMMSGINGITAMLDSGFEGLKKNMTNEQAKEFETALKNSNLDSHIAEFEKTALDLKSKLNID